MEYVRIVDNTPEKAPVNYKDNTGLILNFNKNVGLMLSKDYKAYNDGTLADFNRGKLLIENNEFVENENWDTLQQQAEEDKINNLTMTALDFVTFVKSLGITSSDLKTFLEANPEIDEQLKYCQSVYCGVVKSLLPITVNNITITSEIVENAFKAKHGTI